MSKPDHGLDLHIGRRKTGVSVHPDPVWPAMWRVHQGGRVSDMVNISRAKEAAISWARPRGLGASEVAHWRRRETRAEAGSGGFERASELGEPSTSAAPEAAHAGA